MAGRQSLASLLNRHEEELHRLYRSLGSPTTVVDDKLAELHQALIGTIERQRQDAEQEVASVKSELDSLKRELSQLASVLGCKLAGDPVTESLVIILANRRKALTTLNELRTERLADFRKLYSAFQHLVPILGQTFFDPDLAIPLENGKSRLDDRVLTLVRQRALQTELGRCEQAVVSRTEQLAEQIADLGLLYDELEIEAPPESESLFVPDTADPVLPTEANLQLVTRLLDSLDSERQAREAKIQTIYDSLFALWAKLGVPEDYMEEFVESYAGISNECISAYEKEHARMVQVKNENMQLWIRKEREELRQLKVDLFMTVPEDQQEEDEDAIDFDAGDAILELIEQEKALLVREAEGKRPILLLISKYLELLGEIKQLEESANDPSRLTGKGVRGDPGRLLREEKQRKRIAKERPKLEADLQRLVPAWEAENGQYFMIHGARFLDEFNERMSASVNGRKTRSKTPAQGRAPSAAPSSVSAHTASSARAGVKRQQPPSRPASPTKRHKGDGANLLSASTSSITLPPPPSKVTLPTIRPPPGASSSKIGQITLGKAAHKPRASFRPRPSSLSSLAPSSLFTSNRTASNLTQASSIDERDEC